MEVKVVANILRANEQLAKENHTWFIERGIMAVNVMGCPGAGKTSVILQTIEGLRSTTSIAVVEGDIASTIDADAIAAIGIPVVQINTGGACHLDANMLRGGLQQLDYRGPGIVFIENVGNLVCPAGHDLGEQVKTVIASVSEGHDKPFKYPAIFAEADVILLNKYDLQEIFEFNEAAFIQGIRALNQTAPVIQLSCRTGQGVEQWVEWIAKRNRNI